MTESSNNVGWDDPEDTLPPFPEIEEHYGPDIPSQGGTFRFSQTAGQAWADTAGIEVRLLSPGHGAVRFRVDRPLALRLESQLEEVLAADPRSVMLPTYRPRELAKCRRLPETFVLPFTVDDDPRLAIRHRKGEGRWLYLSLQSPRASLSMQLEFDVAFFLYEWLSEGKRADVATPRALGRVLCDVSWPICPSCLGEPLICSAGLGSCAWCGGRWLAVGNNCGRIATHRLTEITTGERLVICASHAEHARQALSNLVIERLPVVVSSHPQ